MSKLLFLDTETTGLSPELNDIIQVAGICEEDGKELGSFNIFMKPTNFANVSDKALEVNKITRAQLKSFQSSTSGLDEFKKELNKLKGNSGKLIPVGANCKFDLDMVSGLFKKHDAGHPMNYLDFYSAFDITGVCRGLKHLGIIDVENCKLGTLATYFGVTNNKAHDAMEDVRATKQIYYIIKERYFEHLIGMKNTSIVAREKVLETSDTF